MLKIDILYTAITRASKSLSLIGDPEAFVRSIQSTQNLRNTALKERLQSDKHKFESLAKKTTEEKAMENDDESVAKTEIEELKTYILTPEMIENFAVDPMVGMENIKP